MTRINPDPDRSREPKQARGRATLDALVSAGRRLVEEKSFEELSVAEISEAAGCSVGSFYLRFKDKDAFLRALVADMLAQHVIELPLGEKESDDEVLGEMVRELLARYRRCRGLLRAAIRMSMSDPTIWEPLKRHGHSRGDFLISYLGQRYDEQHIRFALQVLYGTVNNTILLAPGPLSLDDQAFERELLRAFKMVLKGA